MNEQILCNEHLKVVIGGMADRSLLYVKDGAAIRFWCDTSELEMALLGVPAHLDALGGSCCVEVGDESAKITFNSGDNGDYSCEIPRKEFADAVRKVRESQI